MSDVERALAFVAKRRGRRDLPAAEWVHLLSLDLGWMTPAQARDFVARAKDAGTLWADGETLRFTVDPAAVAIPFGFRPDPAAQPQGRIDPFAGLAQAVATRRGVALPEILAQVAARQQSMGGQLTALAAALWLAAEAGLDVRAEAARFVP